MDMLNIKNDGGLHRSCAGELNRDLYTVYNMFLLIIIIIIFFFFFVYIFFIFLFLGGGGGQDSLSVVTNFFAKSHRTI